MASGMPESIRQRFDRYRLAERTWDPVAGGKRPLIAWDDKVTADLGHDPDGHRFKAICDRMLTGHYYPSDTIDCFGPWIDDGRDMRSGDRILQRARLLPFAKWPVLWSMTEVFAAERTEDSCTLGYVTTRKHFGRGIWQATLRRGGEQLVLSIDSISGPGSFLFWLGLPIARYLQRRAWRRAVEEFRSILGQ